MPVSTSVHLTHCLGYIVHAQPSSILDVGCGFGTWGYLCRTFLDVFPGRVQPDTWQVHITGLELFEPYIQAHQRHLYDEIRIADIRTAIEDMPEYDLIIAGDVIEHLDRDDADKVLDALYTKARIAMMVNIPLGDEGWDHPENHGNPGELHRSAWHVEDFAPYPSAYKTFDLPNGQYGSFYCHKQITPAQRVAGMVTGAEFALQRGRPARALELLRGAHALAPADTMVGLMRAECALQAGAMGEAAEALSASLSTAPETHRNYLLLARLYRAQGEGHAAQQCLQRLLALPNVDVALRVEAESLLAS
jgi:predicted TPR repeat methyltransferase